MHQTQINVGIVIVRPVIVIIIIISSSSSHARIDRKGTLNRDTRIGLHVVSNMLKLNYNYVTSREFNIF